VSLAFSTKAASPAASRAASLDISVTIGANTVVITKAQLVLRKIELKPTTETTCAEDDNSPDDCEEIELGPQLVDLPLIAGTASQITASVPAGTYQEIEFKIHKPGTTTSDQAFVAAHPEFANASIRVEGTFNGTPFVFTSAIEDGAELEFDPPVVISADNQNITVAVDLSKWFVVNGQVIDPTTANPGQPNAEAVAANIHASLRAFEDENEDGEEDD
jgi:hypothetical protein